MEISRNFPFLEVEGVNLVYEPICAYGQAFCQYEGNLFVWGGMQNDRYEEWLGIKIFCTNLSNPNSPFWLKIKCDSAEDGDSLPPPSCGCSMVLIRGQLVIFIGHAMRYVYTDGFMVPSGTWYRNDIYILSLATLKWRKVEYDPNQLVPSPRDKCSSWTYNNLAYFFGGFGPALNCENEISNGDFIYPAIGRMWNNQLLSFNVEDNTWKFVSTKGKIPSPRAASAACISKTGKVYLFGGRSNTERLNDLHMLDMKSLFWTKIEMKNSETVIGRSWCTVSVTSEESFIYVWGGRLTGEDGGLSNEILVGNLKERDWLESKKKDFRYWHAGCFNENEGIIYAIGGFSESRLAGPVGLNQLPAIITDYPEPAVDHWRAQPASLKSLAFRKLDYKNIEAYKNLGNIQYSLALRALFNGVSPSYNFKNLTIPRLLNLANLKF